MPSYRPPSSMAAQSHVRLGAKEEGRTQKRPNWARSPAGRTIGLLISWLNYGFCGSAEPAPPTRGLRESSAAQDRGQVRRHGLVKHVVIQRVQQFLAIGLAVEEL